MIPQSSLLVGSDDGRLVALSIVIATYAALDLAGRITAARGHLRVLRLSGGTFALGTGIWSKHYMACWRYVCPSVTHAQALRARPPFE